VAFGASSRCSTAIPALAAALLLAGAAPARAGGRLPLFDAGVRGGVNVAMLSFDTLPPSVTDSHRFGYVAGGSIAYPLWAMGAVESGLVFSEQGGVIEGTVTLFNRDFTGKGTLVLTYLSFPLLLKVTIPAGKVAPYVKLGPQLGVRVASKIKVERAGDSVPVEDDFDDYTSSTDWSLYFAGGVQFPGDVATFFEFGYGLGLTEAVEVAELVGIAAQNSVFSITAGFLF
jgi:hypothetical protein